MTSTVSTNTPCFNPLSPITNFFSFLQWGAGKIADLATSTIQPSNQSSREREIDSNDWVVVGKNEAREKRYPDHIRVVGLEYDQETGRSHWRLENIRTGRLYREEKPADIQPPNYDELGI